MDQVKRILQRGEQEIRIVIPIRSADTDTDSRLYSIALALEKPLKSRIESTVFSEPVRLTRIEIRPGRSVEFWITFAAAYELVSKQEELERFGFQTIQRFGTIIQGQFSEIGIHDLKLVGPSSKGSATAPGVCGS